MMNDRKAYPRIPLSIRVVRRAINTTGVLVAILILVPASLNAQARHQENVASLEETARWLNTTLAANNKVSYEADTLRTTRSNLPLMQINYDRTYDSFRMDRCDLSFTETYKKQTITRAVDSSLVEGNVIKEMTSKFDLSLKDIDASGVEASEFVEDRPSGYKSVVPVWSVPLRTTGNKPKIHAETGGRKGTLSAVRLVFADRGTAQRVGEALKRAVALCRGKSG